MERFLVGIILMVSSLALSDCKSGVRLSEGTEASIGRLEVRYDGVWGTVCGWVFGSTEARVACKSMGYDDGELMPIGAGYPITNEDPIWLDGVKCNGDEWALEMCYHNGYGNVRYECEHKYDVWLYCSSKDENHNAIDIDVLEEETNMVVDNYRAGSRLSRPGEK